MKIEKGHPGYIKSQKTKYLIWSILEFGYRCSGSRMPSGSKDVS